MKVTLLTRAECHLCHEARDVLERVRADLPFDLEVVDVDSDPALASRYGTQVPVIFVEGSKFAKYRVDERLFRGRLRRG